MPEEFHNQYEAPRKDIPWTPESFTQTPVNSRFETPTRNASTESSSSILPPLRIEMRDAEDIYESAWSIRQAAGRGTAFVLGTDENRIFNVLQNLTETQRQDLRQVYKMEYGISLEAELKREMSGRDLEKANNLLNRKDGTTDNAGFVRELVTELNHYVQGRSRDSIAEALRQKLVTMSSGDIDKMNQDYQKRYGKTAFDTVMNQSRLSPGNKEALKILFKGSDKTGDSDMAKLAKIAMGKGDLEMFAEAMSHTSPSGRAEFAKKSGDLKSLNSAFNSSFMSMAEKAAKLFKGPAGELIDRSSGDQAVSHALDYMKYGKLSAPTQVIESSGWIDDNEKSIETALNTMSGEERNLYTTGAQLAERKGAKPTQQEQEAIDYYKGLRSAFSRVGDKNEIAKWDDLARVKGGSHEKKTVADLLSENRGVLYNNRSAIVDGLLNLSDKEIEKYRNDKSFQKQVDSSVERALGGGSVYSKSAKHILDEIKTEGKAEDDIIVKMYRDGSNWDADDAGVVRSVEKAFKADPELQRKVASPQTQDERAYSNKFKDALKSALGADYQTYGKKLIADGHLSIKDHTDLCQGYIYDDVASMAKSVATADGEEKKQLLSYDSKDRNAKELQNHVFSNFWGEQSDYLKTVLRAGTQSPEDTMRSFVVGGGATGKDVLDLYSQLDAKQQAKMNIEYAKKYESCLITDLTKHLTTEESGMLPSVVKTEGATLESMYNEYLNRYTTSKDGIGEWFVNEHWDGTGYQAQDAVNQYADALRQSGGNLDAFSEQRQREMAKTIAETLHNFTLSKRAAGEAVGNAAIVAAAVAATPFTSGLSLTLLSKAALFGAGGTVIKVATASAFNGADYTSTQMAVDGGTGFVSGAMMSVGPRELAQLAKLGSGVGTSAAGASLDGLAILSEKAGESIIKDGSKEVVQKTFVDLVQRAILSNSDEVPTAALKELAAQVATKGNERVVQMSFELAMQKATQEATANLLAVKATQYGLPTISGGASGTLSGGIHGASQWDSRDPIGKNISKIGVSAVESGVPSALSAFATSAAMDMAFRGPRTIKTQNDQTRDNILKNFLKDETASSESEALKKVWTKGAVDRSIAENQQRMRYGIYDGSLVLAKKQSYEVLADKVTDDVVFPSLENKAAEAKTGQWIVTRLNADGTPNIEEGILNRWANAEKSLVKTYLIGDPKNLELPQIRAWTNTSAPPVMAMKMSTSGKFQTPWGPMNFQPGDYLINYDYDFGNAKAGQDFARVTAQSWKQTYEIVPWSKD